MVNVCWMHESYSRGIFDVQYVPSAQQCADVFTKQFTDKSKWLHAVSLINIVQDSELPTHLTHLLSRGSAPGGGFRRKYMLHPPDTRAQELCR